ncbi:MAG: RNA methyltransferase [Saprospiraceae bacterium]|nr:RNA methyltransferase [Saprospiraceae bacterium]
MHFPEAFLLQMQTQLGNEFSDFLEALDTPAPTSIRWNLQKDHNNKDHFDHVKWCNSAIYLPERPIFTLDPLFHAGVYYVQEASSMFIAEAVRQIVNLNKPVRTLDLCAAPGGKSTLLASILHKESFLLCNEVIKSRYHILKENLIKWGYPNVHTSSHDSRDFIDLEGFFDLVLVDAPCSGEGLFRKDKRAIAEWSPNNVQGCAARQKRILADAVKALKYNGILIYCTCTYNEEENEQNAKWLVNEFGLEHIVLEIPDDWGIVSKTFGYQFYPHRVRGEGFYIACFRKKHDIDVKINKNLPFKKWKPLPNSLLPVVQKWVKNWDDFAFFQDDNGIITGILKTQLEDCQIVAQNLYRSAIGLEIGTIKGKDFVPSHALALSTNISDSLLAVNLNKEQALRFLKKEHIQLESIPEGWALARFEGQNLGWIKGIGNRINNYLPKDWRILMELPTEN